MIKMLTIFSIGLSLVGCAEVPDNGRYHEQITYSYPAIPYYPSVRVYSGYPSPYYVHRNYVVNQVYVTPRYFDSHDDRSDGNRINHYREDQQRAAHFEHRFNGRSRWTSAPEMKYSVATPQQLAQPVVQRQGQMRHDDKAHQHKLADKH